MAPSAPLRVWQGEIPCHKRAIWACGRLVDDVKLEKMGEAEKVDRVEKEQDDVNMGEREQHLESFTTRSQPHHYGKSLCQNKGGVEKHKNWEQKL